MNEKTKNLKPEFYIYVYIYIYNEYQDDKDENISRERWMYKLILEKNLKDRH